MDKVLSARVDEAVILRIGALAQQLGTTKKAVIERAVQSLAERVEAERNTGVLEQTLGAWQRDESPDETVERTREAFRDSMARCRG